MSLRPYLFFAAFLACASAGHAVRPAPAAAAPEPKKDAPAKIELPQSTEPVPPYELKNRSTFANVTEASRVPFWPIGWVRHAKGQMAQVPEEPKMTLEAKNFKVTSILVGSGTMASLVIINGRTYSEGEFLRTPRTSSTTSTAPMPPVKIRVQKISDGAVTLQSGTQTLVVPLTRPELGARRPEELLNDKDR